MMFEAFADKFHIGFRDGDSFVHLFQDSLNRERCLAAIHDGKLVGILTYQTSDGDFFQLNLFRLFSRFNPIRASRILTNLLLLHSGARRDEFVVDALVVDPETRGLGVGTKLLARAEVMAREFEKARMKLSVVGENTGAIRLYERVGYATYRTETGLCVRLVIRSDKALDMEKVLVEG